MYKLIVKLNNSPVATFLGDCCERCVVQAMEEHSASKYTWSWA